MRNQSLSTIRSFMVELTVEDHMETMAGEVTDDTTATAATDEDAMEAMAADMAGVMEGGVRFTGTITKMSHRSDLASMQVLIRRRYQAFNKY